MKVHQAFQTVLLAPLIGLLSYFGLIGQFRMMVDASAGSVLGFVFFSWIIAMMVTVLIGFPLGFALSAILRRLGRESLVAYMTIGPTLAFALAVVLGDEAMGLGFVVTSSVLALGYWRFIARPRIESGGA